MPLTAPSASPPVADTIGAGGGGGEQGGAAVPPSSSSGAGGTIGVAAGQAGSSGGEAALLVLRGDSSSTLAALQLPCCLVREATLQYFRAISERLVVVYFRAKGRKFRVNFRLYASHRLY